MRGNYGMIALDEGHKARVRRGIGMDEPETGQALPCDGEACRPDPALGDRDRDPDPDEPGGDLGPDESCSPTGRITSSAGRARRAGGTRKQALDLISGKTPCRIQRQPGLGFAPLSRMHAKRPCSETSGTTCRSEDDFFTDKGSPIWTSFTRETLEDVLKLGEISRKLPFMRFTTRSAAT